MATIQIVVNAVNNASRTFKQIGADALVLAKQIEDLQQSVDDLAASNVVLGDAVDSLGRRISANTGRLTINTAALKANTDALNDLAKSSVVAAGAQSTLARAGNTAGAAALFGLRGWGAFLAALARPIPLFGGQGLGGLFKSIATWHLLIDLGAEWAATLIPALIAVGVWAGVATGVVIDMYNAMKNVYTVVTATDHNIYPFTGHLAALQKAITPSLWVDFGSALVVVQKKFGELDGVVKGTSIVVQNLVTRMSAALVSGGLDAIMKHATTDFAEFGNIVGNLFGIFGSFLKSLPGYAEPILGFFDGLTRVLEALANSPIAQWFIRIGLAAHGAIIYLGLLSSALMFITRISFVGLIRALDLVESALAAMNFEKAAGAASNLMESLSGAAEFMTGPWGIAIQIAAAAIGFLIYKFVTAKDSVQQFISALQTKIGNQSAVDGMQALANGIRSVNMEITSLGPAAKYQPWNSVDIAAGTQAVNTFKAQAIEYKGRMADIAKSVGGMSSAYLFLSQSGLTLNQFLSKNANQWEQDKIAILGAYDAFKALGAKGGTLGNDVSVMGMLNGVASEQVKAIQQLNQAWDQYIGIVTGSQSAFDTYGQGIATLDKAQSTATLHLGKYTDAVKLAHGAIDGTSQADIALNQAFTTQVTQTNSLIDAWRSAGIEGGTLTTGVKNAIEPLLKYAQGSKEATAQLVALASEAGYNGPVSLATLTTWLGKTHDSLAKVKAISDLATIAEAKLTSAFEGQGAAIANQLIGQLNDSILKYAGVTQAVVAYGKALATQGAQSQAAHTARQNLINDIVKAGEAAHQTQGQIATMIAKVLQIPLKRALQIVVNAEGAWKITGMSGQYSNKFITSKIGIAGAASGMYISNGRKGVDDQLILAQKGELVVPTHMVEGGAVAHLKGKIPGYATGGIVGNTSSANPATVGQTTQNNYVATVNDLAAATAAATAAGMRAAEAAASAAGSAGGHQSALFSQIEQWWVNAGGPGGALARIAAAITGAESSFNVLAVQQGQPYATTGWGLWQITPGDSEPQVGVNSQLLTGPANAAAAVAKYHQAGNQFTPWTTYMDGAYLRYYDRGGWLAPGLTMAVNATGKPEKITPPGGSVEEQKLGEKLDTLASLLDETNNILATAPDDTAVGVAKAIGGAVRGSALQNLYSTRG